MDIPNKLRILMDERNLTTYALAEKAGLKQSTVSSVVSRGSIPSFATLDAMCKGLGITLHEFFLEDEDPNATIELIKRLYQNLDEKPKQIILDLLKELQK